ncbi:MAG: 4-coumarate--CoA ligase family protein [Chloroflexota bacterium]
MIFRSPYPDVTIPDMNVSDFVLSNAASLGEKPALIEGSSGRTITFGQLATSIQKVAASLVRRGLRKGDILAIYSPNIPEYAIAFHAVAKAGGINTTVNPLYTADELTHQLNDAGAKFLMTVPMFLDKAQEAVVQTNVEEIFVIGDTDGATPFAELLEGDGTFPPVEIEPAKDLVVLPYSSGTTGLPKGVMLSHRNLVANMLQTDNISDAALVTEDDIVVAILPFFHIYGMVVIMNYTLAKGATVVTMPRFDMEEFLGLVQKYSITRANLVPPIILGLAKHPAVDNYDLSSLTLLTSGAAPLGKDLIEATSQRIDCVVTQGYGLTETSPVTHVLPDSRSALKPGSIGPAISNTEVMIVDVASGEALGPNQSGEVWIRGPQVMKGYLNNPTATAGCIDDEGWFHTGDVGYADEDGDFYIVDRVKELIKYKGFQVAPAELEALLLSHEAIADAAVIPSPDEEAGEIPKAFVVLKGAPKDAPNENWDADALMAWVSGQVAPHKKIRRLAFVDEIPKSASGKILRRLLVEQERRG